MLFLKPIFKEIYAVIIGYQICVTYGIILGYSAYLLPQIKNGDYGFDDLDDQTAQLIGVAGVALRPVGAIIAVSLVDVFGRIRTQKLAFLCLVFSWISVTQSFNPFMLIVTRLVNGAFTGFMACGLVYISEITEGSYCSIYLSIYPTSLTIGYMITSFIMYFVDWKITGWILAFYSLLSFGLLCTVPESAHWYITRGQRENAEKTLLWFGRFEGDQVKNYLNQIQSSTETKPTMKQKLECVRQPAVLKLFLNIWCLTILGRLTGYMIINNYSVEFFANMQTIFDSEILSIVFAVICFLSGIGLSLIVNMFKLKDLMIYSSISMILTSLVAAICLILCNTGILSPLMNYVSQLVLIIVFLLYTVLICGANSEVPWIIAGMLFPTTVRATLYGILDVFDTLSSSIISYFISYIIYDFLFVPLFLGFGLFSIIILWLSFYLPKDV